MLTNKTKKDFEIYFITELRKRPEIGNDRYFDEGLLDGLYSADLTIQFSYAINFFDSKGIYIEISIAFDRSGAYNRGFEGQIYQENESAVYHITDTKDVFENRQDALKSAIEKANEIYNS